MEKFSKYAKESTEAHFDAVAENYEGAYLRAGYPDPEKVAEYVNYYSSGFKNKDDVRIMDFACGTGLVGKHL